jgi:hypothetical protein
MKYRHAFWGLCLLAFSLTLPTATAQVGIGTTTPNANSILELNGSNKGLLLPRMTTAQRIAFGLTLGAADEGMIVMDTDLNTLLLWNGTSFSSPTRDWRTTGNSNVGVGDYLGTNDNADLSIRTNGTERIGINGTTGVVSLSTTAGGGDRLLTVDNAGRIIASSAVATNGLTQIGNTLRLGGSLLFSTTLSSGGFNFTFDGPGNLLMTTGARLGIGVTGFPGSALSIGGATGDFRVNSNGTILAATGITSSGTITFSGLGGGGNRVVGVDNTGLLSAVTAAIVPAGTANNNTLRWNGAWVESSNIKNTGTSVGIGISGLPSDLLSVGGGIGNFRVNASGDIVASASISASGTINFSGLGTGVIKSSAGLLSSGLVNLGTEVIGTLPLTSTSGTLPVARGGTGFNVTPTNGQILIGNGTGYTLANITAGSGISVTPGVGSITIASTGGLANGTGTNNTLRWNGSAWVESNNLTNDADGIGIGSSPIPGNKLWVSYFGVTTPGSSGIASIINSTATSGSARALNADVTHSNGGDGEGISLNVSGNSGSGSSWGIFTNVQGAATGSKTAFQSNVSGAGAQSILTGSLSADAATTDQTGSTLSLSTNGNNVFQTGLSLNLFGASTNNKSGLNIYVSDATAGTTTGLNVNVSGGAFRNAAVFTGGNVGITLDPTQTFSVGGFQVNHTGAIAAATGITSTGNINFSSLGGGGSRVVTVDNTGLLSAVPLSTLPANNANSILFNDGAAWLATNTSGGANTFAWDGAFLGIGAFANPNTKINVNYAAGTASGAIGQSLQLTSSATAGNVAGYYSDVTHTAAGGANGIYSRVEGGGGTGNSTAFFAFPSGTSSGSKTAYDASISGAGGQNGLTANLTGSTGTVSQLGSAFTLSSGGFNVFQTGLSLNLSGASSAGKIGAEISVAGSSGTTRGLTVGVSGTGTNYAATFNGGNVGIGTNAPTNTFTVGASNQFQIDASGAIVSTNGITSFGATTLSALGGGGTRIVSVDNTGLLSAVAGSILPANSNTSLLYNNGTNWLATPTTGAGQLSYDGNNIGFGQAITAGQKFSLNYSAGATATPSALVANLSSSSLSTTNASGVVTQVFATNASNAIGTFNYADGGGSGTAIAVSNTVAGTGSGAKTGVFSSVSGTGTNIGYNATLNGSPGVTTQTAYTANLGGAAGITSQVGASLALNTSTNNIPQTGLSLNLLGASTSNKTGAVISVAGATAGVTQGLSVSVSGTGTNYAATFTGGNVGIGTMSPANLFSVGTASQFQVNSTGAIASAAGITSSGAINFSGPVTFSSFGTGVVRSNAIGNLISGSVNLTSEVANVLPIANGGTGTASIPTAGQLLIGSGSGYAVNTLNAGTGISITNAPGSITINATGSLPANSNTSLLYNDGTIWRATPTTGAGVLVYDGSNIGFGQAINATQKFGMNYNAGGASFPAGFVVNLNSSSAISTDARGIVTGVTTTSSSNAIGIFNNVQSDGSGSATAITNSVTGTGIFGKIGVSSFVSGSGPNTGSSLTMNGVVGTTTQNGYTANIDGASGITSQTGASLALNTNANNITQTGLSMTILGASTSNKIGASISVSGATAGISRGLSVTVAGTGTNYAATFTGGNVGIGTTTPSNTFTVGASNQFQIDATGAIVSTNGITSSGATTLTALSGGGSRFVTVDNTGLLSAVTGSVLPANSTNSILYNNGTNWIASATTGATAFAFSGLGVGIGAPVTSGYKMYVNYPTATAQNQRAIGANLTSDATAGTSKGIESSITGTSNGAIAGVTSTTITTGGTGTSYGLYTDLSGAGTGNKIGTSIFVAGAGQHIGLEASLTGGATTTNQVGQSLALATGGNNINQTGQNINLTGTSTSNKTGSTISVSGATAGITRGLQVTVAGTGTNYAATFTGGNVGIGTTTPGFPLDVVGNTNISGNLNTGGFITSIDHAFIGTLAGASFATLPTLVNAQDGNLATFSGGGITGNVPGNFGTITLDMLSVRKGILYLDARMSTTASHNAGLLIETSKDNSLFVPVYSDLLALTPTVREFGIALPVSCRYVRIRATTNATGTVTFQIGEIVVRGIQ